MTDDVYFLTVEEVVAIHADQIDRYGGDGGLRDGGLLDSAVHALVFLHQNGIEIDDPGEQLYDVMISAAAKAIGKQRLARRFGRWSCQWSNDHRATIQRRPQRETSSA